MSFRDNPQFAPEYSRDEHGWIIFPSDTDYRSEVFPREVNEHTAKANVFLVQSIIEFVSQPGEMLMDIMSGTGTLMIGALAGRSVICLEVSPKFHELQQTALEKLESIAPGASDRVMLLNVPCQTYLPIPDLTDHIIFSPPYASIMKSKGTDKLTQEKTDYDMAEYTFTSPLNIGLMNDFIWMQEMERVYAKCFETIKSGGTLSVIVKDHYEKQKDGTRPRIQLSQSAWDACMRAGFMPKDWLKWKAPGSVYTHIYRARGWEVVDDEDILIVQKPRKEPVYTQTAEEHIQAALPYAKMAIAGGVA